MLRLTFRKASEDDYEFYAQSYCSGMKPYIDDLWGWDQADMDKVIKKSFSDEDFYIIEHQNKRIGYMAYQNHKDFILASHLMIAPEHQRKGFGQQFMNDFIKHFGTEKIRLKVLKNSPAQELYKKNGFTVYDQDKYRLMMERQPQ